MKIVLKIAGAWQQKLHVLTAETPEITGRKLTKFGKKIQIHHLHMKSFHMVKRLRK